MQWLNYHHLYYFYIIAIEGGITPATSKLKLAQSTLSAQLKQFEDAIGYQLFERKNRRLELTDVGRRVYEYAHEIFSLGNELRDSLGTFEESLGVSLRLGVMDSIPGKIVRDVFCKVTDEFEARTIVQNGPLPVLCQRLKDHEIDIVLANDKPPVYGPKTPFHAKLIGELKVVFVGSSEMTGLREQMPRALNDQPMIMPGVHSPLRQEVEEHLRIKKIYPRIVGEIEDVEIQRRLAIEGVGFTALPLMAVEKDIEAGRLVVLSPTPICHENLWLITGHRLVHNPIAQNLLKTFRPTNTSVAIRQHLDNSSHPSVH